MSERDEGVVRMDAGLHAITCEVYALLAHMEGMKADNQQAIMDGRDLPHTSGSFGAVSGEFDQLAKRFRTEI